MSGSSSGVWKETNGADGLQVRETTCGDGSVIPADEEVATVFVPNDFGIAETCTPSPPGFPLVCTGPL